MWLLDGSSLKRSGGRPKKNTPSLPTCVVFWFLRGNQPVFSVCFAFCFFGFFNKRVSVFISGCQAVMSLRPLSATRIGFDCILWLITTIVTVVSAHTIKVRWVKYTHLIHTGLCTPGWCMWDNTQRRQRVQYLQDFFLLTTICSIYFGFFAFFFSAGLFSFSPCCSFFQLTFFYPSA